MVLTDNVSIVHCLPSERLLRLESWECPPLGCQLANYNNILIIITRVLSIIIIICQHPVMSWLLVLR